MVVGALAALLVVPAGAVARPARALKLGVAKPAPLGVGGPGKIKVRVRVKNAGPGRARGVRITVRAPKGVAVRPRRKRIRSLRPGRARTVKFRVTRSPAALKFTKLKLHAVATARGRRTARRSARVPLGLAGRYFWSADPFDELDHENYYFVDRRWAIAGAPEGGLPTHCTAAMADAGCVRYTYDPADGALEVGEEEGTVEDDGAGVKIEDDWYTEMAPLPAGSHFDMEWSGLFGDASCIFNCTFVSSGLTLISGGEFARSVAVTGSTPINNFAVLPADQHGTYAFADRGRLRLAYADGHTETVTFVRFRDFPLSYGMVLGGSLYTGPTF